MDCILWYWCPWQAWMLNLTHTFFFYFVDWMLFNVKEMICWFSCLHTIRFSIIKIWKKANISKKNFFQSIKLSFKFSLGLESGFYFTMIDRSISDSFSHINWKFVFGYYVSSGIAFVIKKLLQIWLDWLSLPIQM